MFPLPTMSGIDQMSERADHGQIAILSDHYAQRSILGLYERYCVARGHTDGGRRLVTHPREELTCRRFCRRPVDRIESGLLLT
jgi:hypothetical protein